MNPWSTLLRFLGSTLEAFYSIAPNYGVAIILLTIAVSLLLFPLTLKQTRSMRAMQEIQPEIKKLQKEYKADRQELNKHLMELYKERGVNPAAGCLPLIVQMPIWFALFSVLRVRAENGGLSGDAIAETSNLGKALIDGQTTFLSMDLLESPSDISSVAGFGVTLLPYLVLILIVMASGYVQQIQTTRKRDGSQQQQPQGMQAVLKIMPLFFGFISWTFPTGLVLYFAVSNLFRVGQQAVILGLNERPNQKSAAKEVESGPSGDTAPGPSRPSPHASKKRKKRRRK